MLLILRLVFKSPVIKLKQITGRRLREARVSQERRTLMAIQVCWLDNLAKAQETARKTNKPILLDFFNPQ
jgi:hypothetical protein